MKDINYYNKFKKDLEAEGIIIKINRYGFFRVILDKTRFEYLEKIEDNGLRHILNYDYFELDGKYRLIKKLEFMEDEEI